MKNVFLSVLSVYIVLPKAPEILDGHGVGPETDIWAVGVLTFIMYVQKTNERRLISLHNSHQTVSNGFVFQCLSSVPG